MITSIRLDPKPSSNYKCGLESLQRARFGSKPSDVPGHYMKHVFHTPFAGPLLYIYIAYVFHVKAHGVSHSEQAIHLRNDLCGKHPFRIQQ